MEALKFGYNPRDGQTTIKLSKFSRGNSTADHFIHIGTDAQNPIALFGSATCAGFAGHPTTRNRAADVEACRLGSRPENMIMPRK